MRTQNIRYQLLAPILDQMIGKMKELQLHAEISRAPEANMISRRAVMKGDEIEQLKKALFELDESSEITPSHMLHIYKKAKSECRALKRSWYRLTAKEKRLRFPIGQDISTAVTAA